MKDVDQIFINDLELKKGDNLRIELASGVRFSLNVKGILTGTLFNGTPYSIEILLDPIENKTEG